MNIDFQTMIKENGGEPFKGVIHLGSTNLGKTYEANGVEKVLWVNSNQSTLRSFYDSMKLSSTCKSELLPEDFSIKPFCKIYKQYQARLDLDQYSFVYVEHDPTIVSRGFGDGLLETFPGILGIYLRNTLENTFQLDGWMADKGFRKNLFSIKHNPTTNNSECDVFYLRAKSD